MDLYVLYCRWPQWEGDRCRIEVFSRAQCDPVHFELPVFEVLCYTLSLLIAPRLYTPACIHSAHILSSLIMPVCTAVLLHAMSTMSSAAEQTIYKEAVDYSIVARMLSVAADCNVVARTHRATAL